MGFEDLHVAAPAAEALASMGWDTDHAMARDMAPTAARGHNLVAVTPPSPAYSAPALAGLLGRLEGGAQLLLLVPAAELEVWGALVNRLAREMPLRVQTARGEARALRRLRAGALDVLIASPDTALSLLRRSALKPDSLGAVFLAWPERLDDADALTALMHDLPKDAQRVVVTSDQAAAADLVERYARKALTVGMPAPEGSAPAAAGTVRTASVAWERRVQALAELVELLDPASLAIWAADRSYEAEIGRALPLGDEAVHFTTGDAPAAELVVAFDLPDAGRIAQLRAAGSVVLLVPPGTEPYAARVAPSSTPVRLPGLLDEVMREAGKRRAAIVERIAGGTPDRALLTLAPLFERYDPSAVAAALFELWSAGGTVTAPDAAGTQPVPQTATGKIWVGIGKSDGATAADFVGTMTKELRIDRASIGRIELKDSFSLIEVPAADVERIAGALNGVTIRRKRLIARADRGQTRDRPGPRDRSGPRKPPAGSRPPRRPA
ncbi:MAG TPA: DbpA RNA binding domain-containing protein [Gemmatimonadales bacterium]|nr:DbpA RNA binding domain-containing protein [Gemmatimonadales bacterium]